MTMPTRLTSALLVRAAVIVGLGALTVLLLWPPFRATADGVPHKIVLQLKWTHQFQFAGYYAALEQGYFRDAGLDVTIAPGGPETDAIDEVVSGRAEFGVGNSSLLLDRAAGKPVVVPGVIYQHSPLVLLARSDGAAQGLASLAGGRLMIEPHSADLLAMLQHERVSLENLTFLPHPGHINGLLNDEVDAISAYLTDETYLAQRASLHSMVFSPRGYGIDFYGDNFFTREEIARGNPDLAQRFYRATIRGWEYAYQHQDELIDLIQAADRALYRAKADGRNRTVALPLLAPVQPASAG